MALIVASTLISKTEKIPNYSIIQHKKQSHFFFETMFR